MIPLCILLALWLMVGLAGITRAAVRTYTGQGLQPAIYPELARTDAIQLAPGTYTKGTVLGQMTTLTNANDVQTLTFTGSPTGGTFRLTFFGVETSNITYSTTAATLATNVQTALEAHPYIGTGNVSVAANSGAPQITLQGDLGNRWQTPFSYSTNGLTGGTAPSATFARTTPGRAANGLYRAYDDAQSDGTNIARCVLQYGYVVTPDGRHYRGTNAYGYSLWCAAAWFAGYFRTADLTGLDANGVGDLGRITHGAVGSLSNVATVLKIA